VATARVELPLGAGAEAVWTVVGDFATGPLRMARGHVTGCVARRDVRTVVFADGTVARERLVAVEVSERRIVYAVIGGTLQPEHDNACMQVHPLADGSCRLVWIHDVLPHGLAPQLQAAMRDAGTVIAATFEAGRPDARTTPATSDRRVR
jgi:hypothetical protein